MSSTNFVNLSEYQITNSADLEVVNKVVPGDLLTQMSTSSPVTAPSELRPTPRTPGPIPQAGGGAGDILTQMRFDAFGSSSPFSRGRWTRIKLSKTRMPVNALLDEINRYRLLSRTHKKSNGAGGSRTPRQTLGPDNAQELAKLSNRFDWLGVAEIIDLSKEELQKKTAQREGLMDSFIASGRLANSLMKLQRQEAEILQEQVQTATQMKTQLTAQVNNSSGYRQELLKDKLGKVTTDLEKLQRYQTPFQFSKPVLDTWKQIEGYENQLEKLLKKKNPDPKTLNAVKQQLTAALGDLNNRVGESDVAGTSVNNRTAMEDLGRYADYKLNKFRDQMGCEKRIMVHEMMNNRVDYETGCTKKQTIYGYLMLTMIFVLLLAFLFKQFKTPGVFSVDPDDDDATKVKRQAARGTIASILVSVSFGIINALVDGTGNVDPSTSTALFGMMLGGTIGYLADIGLGSDSGLRVFKEKTFADGWKHMFGNLVTAKYVRYQITILFDMFVSLVLFKPCYEYLTSKPFFKCSASRKSIANGVCSATIAMLTFQAYANQTRFLWAYPDAKSENKNTWIPGSTMMMMTVAMALIFLTTNTVIGYNPHRITGPKASTIKSCYMKTGGLNNPKIKLIIVLVTLMILTGLFFMGSTESVIEKDLRIYTPEAMLQRVIGDEVKRLQGLEKTELTAEDQEFLQLMSDKKQVKLIRPEQVTGTEDFVSLARVSQAIEHFSGQNDDDDDDDKNTNNSNSNSNSNANANAQTNTPAPVAPVLSLEIITRLQNLLEELKSGKALPVYIPQSGIPTTDDYIDRGFMGVGAFAAVAALAAFGTYATSKHTTITKKWVPPGILLAGFSAFALAPSFMSI